KQPKSARSTPEQLKMPQHRRQEVLERIARSQHQAANPLGMAGGDPLGHGATGGVGDEGHVLELKRREERSDEVGDAGQAEIDALVQPKLMRAQGRAGNDEARAAT